MLFYYHKFYNQYSIKLQLLTRKNRVITLGDLFHYVYFVIILCINK